MNAKEIALLMANVVYKHRAKNIIVLDITKFNYITDYFVICTGLTQRHVQGLCDEMSRTLKTNNIFTYCKEGYEEGSWILLDIGDVIVHLYQEEARNFYDIESLWQDAPRVEVDYPAITDEDENSSDID